MAGQLEMQLHKYPLPAISNRVGVNCRCPSYVQGISSTLWALNEVLRVLSGCKTLSKASVGTATCLGANWLLPGSNSV
eukprot:583434-Amphidinium_carterae.1